IENCAIATGEPGLRSEDCVATQISVDAIHLEMSGPEAVIAGEDVTYRITIRNTGDQTLNGLALRDDFDPGLSHASGPSPVQRQLGSLAIGEVRQIDLTFHTEQPGRFGHRLTVTADGVQ